MSGGAVIELFQIKICVGQKKSRLLRSVEPVVAKLAFIGHFPIENWDALPYSRIGTQFRIEMFNLFNRVNLAPPSGTNESGLGITADTIGDYNGAPGLGPGEAFNMQLALKIIF